MATLLPWPVLPDPGSALSQLGSWLDGEAAARLQDMGTEEWSPDSHQGSAEHFKEFLAQATVRLKRLFCNTDIPGVWKEASGQNWVSLSC